MPTAVNLPQLLELSLGTPEVGAVNFNTLHQLLAAIISKLNLNDSTVEFPDNRGSTGKGGIPKATSYSHHDSPLQEKVNKIERELSLMNALPSSRDILSKVKSEQPLTELWQYMQVTKRVENNEAGIKTAMELIQQLVQDFEDIKRENSDLKSRLDKIDMDSINAKLQQLDKLKEKMNGIADLEERFKEMESLKTQLDALQKMIDTYPQPEELVTWPGLEDALSGVRGEFAAYRPESRLAKVMEDRATVMTPKPEIPAVTIQPSKSAVPARANTPVGRHSAGSGSSRAKSAVSDGPSIDVINVLERLGTIDKRHEELKKRVDNLEGDMKFKANKDEVGTKIPDDLLDKVAGLSAKIAEVDDLRRKDADAIRRAQKAVLDLQAELANLQKITDHLSKENDEKTRSIDDLHRQTSRLQDIKADKDYLDAELDTKADKSLVEGKVNRLMFDNAVSDLQKMIDDLLAKLSAYEEAWKHAHGRLEEDVDSKLDRGELERLKTYLDKKLKDLNSKLKQSQGIFNPFCEDAAGLKRQLLPFNCLSCDKPVVVTSQSPAVQAPSGDAFMANKSARPYTTFELDNIRQQAKRIYNGDRPHVHSLLHADYIMDYYSMPRSCGGSHTLTLAQKRMTKSAVSNVFKEPDEVPPELLQSLRDETDIIGADGHIYKGRIDGKTPIEAKLPTTLQQEGRPSTPTRPKSSAGKRPISARPTSAMRPTTASPPRLSANVPSAEEVELAPEQMERQPTPVPVSASD